jgi:hypothetical protein
MVASPRTLFVYYKVPSDQRGVYKAQALSEMAQRAQKHEGLQAQLLQRPEVSAEGLETWMEIYSHADQGVDEALEQALRQSFSDSHLPFKRMVEVFIPLL